MKIVLVNCPFQDVGAPPLEAARLAGVLARQPGVEYVVRDLNAEMWAAKKSAPEADLWSDAARMFWLNPTVAKRWWEDHASEMETEARKIAGLNPDMAVLSLSASSLYFGFYLAHALRRAAPKMLLAAVNHHLLLGSQGESEHWKMTFFLEKVIFDIVIIGPAVDRLAFFLRDWPEHRILRPRPGFHCREEGRVMYGAPPEPVRFPDRLPFADYSGFPHELYERPYWFPVTPAAACSCETCVGAGLGLSAENVQSGTRLFLEAQAHRRRFPRRAAFLVRYPGAVAGGAVSRFCDLILEDRGAGEDNPWLWELHARETVPADLAEKARRAGCRRIVVDRPSMESEADSPAWRDEDLDIFYLPGLVWPGWDARDIAAPSSTVSAGSSGSVVSVPADARARGIVSEASRLLVREHRPAEALRRLREVGPIAPAVAVRRAVERDILLLWAVLKRLVPAERILDRLPPLSREQIWMNTPSLQSAEARPMDFQRHRRIVVPFRDNPWQRAFRFLLTAGARAVRMRTARAKLDYDREVNRFVVLWGRDRLPVRDAVKLCDGYLTGHPEWGKSWAAWRDGVLRALARETVERVSLVDRNVRRVLSLRRRLRAAERLLNPLGADARREAWSLYSVFGRRAATLENDRPPSSWGELRRRYRMKRAARLLAAAAARGARVRGFKVLFDLSGPDGRLSVRCDDRRWPLGEFIALPESDVRALVRDCLETAGVLPKRHGPPERQPARPAGTLAEVAV